MKKEENSEAFHKIDRNNQKNCGKRRRNWRSRPKGHGFFDRSILDGVSRKKYNIQGMLRPCVRKQNEDGLPDIGMLEETAVFTRKKTMWPDIVAQQLKRYDAGPNPALLRMSAAEHPKQEEKQEKELEKP